MSTFNADLKGFVPMMTAPGFDRPVPVLNSNGTVPLFRERKHAKRLSWQVAEAEFDRFHHLFRLADGRLFDDDGRQVARLPREENSWSW